MQTATEESRSFHELCDNIQARALRDIEGNVRFQSSAMIAYAQISIEELGTEQRPLKEALGTIVEPLTQGTGNIVDKLVATGINFNKLLIVHGTQIRKTMPKTWAHIRKIGVNYIECAEISRNDRMVNCAVSIALKMEDLNKH